MTTLLPTDDWKWLDGRAIRDHYTPLGFTKTHGDVGDQSCCATEQRREPGRARSFVGRNEDAIEPSTVRTRLPQGLRFEITLKNIVEVVMNRR